MPASPLHNKPYSSLFVRCATNDFFFFLEHGEPLTIVNALPKRWNKTIISGSKIYSYDGELGQVVIQEYQTKEWTIRYTYFKFVERTILRWQEELLFRIQFALQGKFHYQTPAGKVRLHPSAVNTVWRPGTETQAEFERGKEYVLVHTLYHPDLVRQLLPQFPHNFLRPEKATTPIEKEWLTVLHQILDCPYDGETTKFFFENRVRDILLCLMLQPDAGILYKGLGKEEVLKIHQADALILEDIRHWDHIAGLAKKVGLSEFKLKMAFKQVIGVNLFERLRLARLEKARKLLVETNEQVKFIYRDVGYKSLSGFEEAFQEKFGMGPSQYRKKFKT